MASLVSRAVEKLLSLRLVDTRRIHLLPEQAHLRRLFSHLNVDCVFDVGANTGQYGDMLRRRAQYHGRIISFEPLPEAAAAVRGRAKHDPLWTVEEVALADIPGTRVFNVMASSEFSSLSEPKSDEVGRLAHLNRPVRRIMVEAETLATALPRLQERYGFSRPFLKMDTQGFDLAVLRGAGDALSRFVGFQSELSVRRIYQQAADFREALSFYQSLGFDISAFVPNNAGHFPVLIEIDCIMIRRDLLSKALLPVDSTPAVPHPTPLIDPGEAQVERSTGNGNAA
jgi:FkbM family methyltransferase